MVAAAHYPRVAALLLLAAASCHAARILAVFPALSRSHVISFSALTRELARRGHQVVVISSYPLDRPVDNYTDIEVPLDMFGLDKRMDMSEMQNLNIFENLKIVWEIGAKTCDHYLRHPAVQRLIRSEDEHFDLLIVEVFLNECFLGFSHVYDVPVVGVSVYDAQHWSLAIVGNPSPYAFTPNIFLSYTDHMTLGQRLVNTVGTTVIQCFKTFVNLPQQDAIMRKYFNDSSLPYVGELEQRTSLLLLNSHVSLGYPRPYMPNVVEVGGMHIEPPQTLPENIQKFMDEAKHGVILFSMGTNLKSSHMAADKIRAFVDAFSKLRQRVLWRWDSDVVPGLTSNVRLGKWLPQSSILAHPNMCLLLTHGGLLSMQEAIFYGVPMVGIPIFADQGQNMHRAQHHGFGVRLELGDVTGESVSRALRTVLDQPSYRASAKRLSARFHDQIATPLEKAAYWTEYVLRHRGAGHLRSALLDLAWYEYFLLDVLAILALGGIGLVAMTFYVARAAATFVGARTVVLNAMYEKKSK